ncbi:MAG: adenylate/guanylate cyclase domain-containing protein, partial [Casimicrobiaceae bacterium]
MNTSSTVTTFLFSDIEHSSRLWEQSPDLMAPALARHDALVRSVVARNNGALVKMTGDGMHAVFDDPRDALCASLEFQRALGAPAPQGGLQLRARCGMHAGIVERRDNDFFGAAVNRAARIMAAAHGGQVLASQTVADLVSNRLPEDVRLRDLGSVRLRDLAGPERIFQVMHPSLPDAFPPLRSLESLPNNLPQPTTSFVGRERELADTRTLLARGRLLTLHGAGGIGKTRLSLQLAADALAEFPDGVWFVDLASLSDAQRVPQAVASVLGIKEDAGRPVVEALVRSLRVRRLLIVLDNCEHLIQACAELAVDLLRTGQHLKILATSREPLNVR